MSKSLVLGFFDGVHKAHKSVINSAFEVSKDVVLVTLKETPALYFGQNYEYILSRENSIKKIKELGVKEVIELDFPKIASVKAEKYIENLINTYNPCSISTGFNHTFGYQKLGTPKMLETLSNVYNYKYICLPPIKDGNEIISSTLIKNYLKNGNIEKANLLLESNFILEGTVIHGAKLGRTIGFPTANINYPEHIVKIPYGVYSVKLSLAASPKEVLSGIMNWGMKPTVHNTIEPVAEVHILNYSGDLYDKNIRIEILKQIRGEKRFENLEELKLQIKKDIANA